MTHRDDGTLSVGTANTIRIVTAFVMNWLETVGGRVKPGHGDSLMIRATVWAPNPSASKNATMQSSCPPAPGDRPPGPAARGAGKGVLGPKLE